MDLAAIAKAMRNFETYDEKDYTKLGNKEIAKINDIETLQKVYPGLDKNEIFIKLFLNIYVDITTLKNFVRNNIVFGLGDMILKVKEFSDRLNYDAMSLINIYDRDLSKGEIEYLKSFDNEDINDFLYKNNYIETEIAPTPAYVSKKEDEDISLLEKVDTGIYNSKISTKFDDLVEIYDSAIEGINYGEEGELDKDLALNVYLSTVMEGEVDENVLEKSIQQQRVWGPINRGENDCIGAPGGIGPCRMLYCNCIQDEDEEISDWFEGKCEECKKKILYRENCVRRPLLGGRWKGCYCSYECMVKKDVYYDRGEELLINTTFKKLEEYGIMSRS